MKNKFGDGNIKKIFNFSDGAASQYKNKFNFINLSKDQENFRISAQWNFFAISQGKGACDGIGGAVKRQAYRASLQRVDNNHMTNPRILFAWAQTHFRNIHFNFCPLNDDELHDKTLKARFERGTTIKNTRQYHCSEPVNNKILCRLFSKDSVFVENVISGKRNKK